VREEFSFSSADRDPAEAFAAYVELYAHGSDVIRASGPLLAEVRGWRFEGLLLFERKLSGVIHRRTARVTTDGFDHVVAHVVLDGQLIGNGITGFDRAVAGDIAFVDTIRGNDTEARDAHVLTVSIARHLIEVAVGDAGVLHGRVLNPPASLMLADYIKSLVRYASDVDPRAASAYARALVELLSAALASTRVKGADAAQRDYLRRESVERLIAAELANRALSSNLITDATGLSRSTLYRLFERHGGIARLIGLRRADAVRRSLEAGSMEPIADLAERFGFVSEGHLSRVFAQAYGAPPGSYRTSVRATPEADARTGRRRWRGWMGELI